MRNELAELVGPVWSEGKACDALSVDTDALKSRRETGTVLGLTTSDGVRVYPIFQFHRNDDAVEVKPALVPFLRALREFDPWAVAVILHTPARELDDATPLDWVSRGGSTETLSALADVLVSEWSAGGTEG